MSILLVDGNNLAMRAVHAMARSNLSVDGVPTGPLLVFINALSRHVTEEQPDTVVICWDSGPSHFRLSIHPEYKGTRKQVDPEFAERKEGTFGLVKEFLALANIHQIERPGYEADDLIAWYVDRYRGERPITILSSDKDFLQLLGPGVRQVRFANSGEPVDRWTYQRVIDEKGVRDPRDLVAVMSLTGDSVDNVPGVPRYGEKTAVKHLREVDWNMRALREKRPVVDEHWEQILVAEALVNLLDVRQEMNLPDLPRWNPTKPGNLLWDPLLSFLLRYQMESVKKRLYKGDLWGVRGDILGA